MNVQLKLSVLLLLAAFVAVMGQLSGCVSAAEASAGSAKLLGELGMRPMAVTCKTTFLDEFAHCAVKTVEGQVYTTVCDWRGCRIERGPGQ